MNTLRLLILASLMVSACSVDSDPPVDHAKFSDNDGLTHEVESSSITSKIPPINALWDIHIIERDGCAGVPIPVRMQFSRMSSGRLTAFLAFSNGYSDEADWGMLGDDRVWLGERRISLRYVLDASVWIHEADGVMSTTLHYYGDTECSAHVLAVLE